LLALLTLRALLPLLLLLRRLAALESTAARHSEEASIAVVSEARAGDGVDADALVRRRGHDALTLRRERERGDAPGVRPPSRKYLRARPVPAQASVRARIPARASDVKEANGAVTEAHDDDVATQLFDLCLAEEKKMKGEVEDEDEEDEDEDEDALYIPEDEDDEGP
jgi:hypothetical protein